MKYLRQDVNIIPAAVNFRDEIQLSDTKAQEASD